MTALSEEELRGRLAGGSRDPDGMRAMARLAATT